MSIEIKSWRDGSVLYTAENAQDVRAAVEEAVAAGANLRSANLHSANLRWADLRSANLHSANLHSANLHSADLRWADLHSANLHSADLRWANLHSANLHSADLRWANLHSADLRWANLHSADLRSAKGFNPWQTDDLRILLDQVGKIRAYKLVTKDGEGLFNGGVKYEVGQTIEVKEADTSETETCSTGIHVATLPWCMAAWRDGYRILIVEFTRKDIASIPHGTDGKFRLHRCKVVGEVDLVERGLVVEREAQDA